MELLPPAPSCRAGFNAAGGIGFGDIPDHMPTSSQPVCSKSSRHTLYSIYLTAVDPMIFTPQRPKKLSPTSYKAIADIIRYAGCRSKRTTEQSEDDYTATTPVLEDMCMCCPVHLLWT